MQTDELILRRLVETSSVRVRSHPKALPFWYTAGVPGPFYINVENVAGPTIVKQTLSEINAVLRTEMSISEKCLAIHQRINSQLENDSTYRSTISLLLDAYRESSLSIPDIISGGERRDWFFSIPFAQHLHVPHLYLFKNGKWHIEGQIEELGEINQSVVHVSDIVNTATSYKRYWLPTLSSLGVKNSSTFTVAIRDSKGIEALEQSGIQVTSPLHMNRHTFEQMRDMGLISSFSCDNIALYLESPVEWTRDLIRDTGTEMLSRIDELDDVQSARFCQFISNDVFNLAVEFPRFFETASNKFASSSFHVTST